MLEDEITQHDAVAPVPRTFTLESLVGQNLDDRYLVDDMIGIGAMGAVFRARQTRLRRTVAIKVPKPELCLEGNFLRRFEREALTMAKLVHENIVQIFDVTVSPDPRKPSYIVMEYIEGAELEKFLQMQERDLTVGAVVELFKQVARGLDAAHARDVIHRDIKPSNIVVTMPQRIAKIMDFGIARQVSDDVFKTQEVAAIGTPAYMAPEQVKGEAVTAAADIYAFAMTIYRLMTRSLPYDVDSSTQLVFAQVQNLPKPVYERNPLWPEELHDALLPALDKDPSKRPMTATAVAEAVSEALKPLSKRCFADFFPGGAAEAREGHSAMPGVSRTGVPRLPKQNQQRTLIGLAVGSMALLALVAWFTLPALFSKESKPGETNAGSANAPGPVVPTPTPIIVVATPMPEPHATPRAVATPQPAPPTMAPSPAPTPVPTPSDRPTPTPRKARATLTPTPVPTEEPPIPLPATPTPNLDLLKNAGFWDPAVTPPEKLANRRARMKRDLEEFLQVMVARPTGRGVFEAPDNALALIDSPGAKALIERTRLLQRHHTNLSMSFQIRDDSFFWEDHAALQLDVRMQGHPTTHPDPNFRKSLLKSSTPLTARLHYNGRFWQLLSLDGELPPP